MPIGLRPTPRLPLELQEQVLVLHIRRHGHHQGRGMCVRHVILLIWPTDHMVGGGLSCECGVARPSVKGQPVDVKQSILHAWHQPLRGML